MKILVGSTNSVKIAATKSAFARYFKNINIKGIGVDSGVCKQPRGEETWQGAKNRAISLKKKYQADFYVGIEGGIHQIFDICFSFGCICVLNKKGKIGFGTSPWFELPRKVVEGLDRGEELGVVMDKLTGKKNTKHKMGAIGILTNGVVDRKELYVQGLLVALTSFIRVDLY